MEYYNLGEKPGRYIIINHHFFSEDFPSGEPEPRDGTARDVNAIEKTFTKLVGFKSHRTLHDANKQRIFNKLQRVFSQDFSNFGSIFVFILTHGTEGYILSAYDTTYTLHELLDHVMQHASPSLNGKPKVFVIQACNGLRKDRGTKWAASSGAFDIDYSPQPFILPHIPDVLLAFSSPPGYASHRNLFIPILCKSIRRFARNAYGYDLIKLLTLARRRVGEDVDEDDNQEEPRETQITLSISTLTKKLRLTLNAAVN